jgi:hypothetical protein
MQENGGTTEPTTARACHTTHGCGSAAVRTPARTSQSATHWRSCRRRRSSHQHARRCLHVCPPDQNIKDVGESEGLRSSPSESSDRLELRLPRHRGERLLSCSSRVLQSVAGAEVSSYGLTTPPSPSSLSGLAFEVFPTAPGWRKPMSLRQILSWTWLCSRV